MRNRFTQTYILLAVLLLGASAGWFMATRSQPSNAVQPVREGGAGLINPLLVCEKDSSGTFDPIFSRDIQNAVEQEVSKGDINTASVYYRNFDLNKWVSLNDSEKFYPASLGKVPLMIAYYAWAEATDIPIFSKSLMYAGGKDANAQQEISPKDPIRSGRTYTVQELMDAMVKDSDNNATELLFGNIDQSYLRSVFSDLRVPYLEPGMNPSDFMTVSDFAFFFRVLYNGTYLSHVDSEKALETLSASTFKDGIVAGVPENIKVAHKFGLVSVAPDGNTVTSRELHDCGVVYAGEGPYLLCVMTKSSGSLQNAEHAIAAISSAAYQAASAGK